MPDLIAVHSASISPLPIKRGKDDIIMAMSAITKRPVSTIERPHPIRVDRLGLEGDEQADLSVHGGIEKAVYAYPIEHYPRWQAWLARAERMQYGTLGENLSTQGVVESDLWIGDEMHFDKCVLRVESPRRPCFKLNAVLDNEQAGRFMLAQALTGWYLSVVTPGTLRAGDAFVIVPGPRQISLPERQRQMIRPADTR